MGGGSRFDHCYYTPLYEKGIKKIENKPIETTVLLRSILVAEDEL